MVEQAAVNRLVVGSSPAIRASLWGHSSMGAPESHLYWIRVQSNRTYQNDQKNT